MVNASWVDRACAKVLTQKFAARCETRVCYGCWTIALLYLVALHIYYVLLQSRLFDGALPDPARHVNLNSGKLILDPRAEQLSSI